MLPDLEHATSGITRVPERCPSVLVFSCALCYLGSGAADRWNPCGRADPSCKKEARADDSEAAKEEEEEVIVRLLTGN